MKVKALQGDTVDLLCWRHYGTTQGVTEYVLSANPGLSLRMFLDAGQEVELPELPPPARREIVQLWD
ncbi:tail protein X [Citrobacter freundii]|uniref:tail protein X n=1 Tax=Citrobacter freundii TaxID=546 RepID=UPI0029DAF9FB|nr:tail protein X [Citrobacter freundii]MDX7390688.1 tail protein X [Citrobacter freundii]